MAIQEVTSPPFLDDTAQTVVSKLDAIKNAINPNAQGVSYSHATSGLSAENVQEAVDELDGNIDTLSSSLTNLMKWKLIDTKTGTNAISLSGLTYEEILVIMGSGANKFSLVVPKGEISSSYNWYRTGGYGGTTSLTNLACFRINSSDITAVNLFMNSTTDTVASCTISAYYR